MKTDSTKIVFFGGQPLGVPVLEQLAIAGITPDLIVSNPDRPAGRGQKLTTPPVKAWAQDHQVPVFQPKSYQDSNKLKPLLEADWDLFIVVAYNFILPKWVLELPRCGVLNVHPSLLPKLRGASPIRTAIKNDLKEAVGVSIMLMDEKMDHGPILKQVPFEIADKDWPLPGPQLDAALAEYGGALLAQVVPAWLSGDISPQGQDHSHATYCHQFNKDEAKLSLDPTDLPSGIEAEAALHHIYAFQGIGDSFFVHNGKRVKIKAAELSPDGSLRLLRVTPAGKAEIDFEQYRQTLL